MTKEESKKAHELNAHEDGDDSEGRIHNTKEDIDDERNYVEEDIVENLLNETEIRVSLKRTTRTLVYATPNQE